MRALVIGGNGFVGRALIHGLLAAGHSVRAVVRQGAEPASLPNSVDLQRGDLADPNTLAAAALGCEVLYHCAGESAAHAALEALAWLNVAGTENMLAAARSAKVARVVIVSCADATLMNRDRIHWKEDVVLGQAPLGALSRSKLLAEEIALQASDRQMIVTALRPAFLWGADDHVNLPGLCREARSGGIRLFGAGDNFFASTHIDNLVAALIAAGSASGVAGLALHVADGEFVTAREFFAQLSAALSLPAPRAGFYPLAYAAAQLRRSLRQPGAWPEQVAARGRGCLLDCERAMRLLGYAPATTLAQGMRALSEWSSRVGGPEAIERLARPPAAQAEIEHHRQLADELRA